jgi:hypothetical protein
MYAPVPLPDGGPRGRERFSVLVVLHPHADAGSIA